MIIQPFKKPSFASIKLPGSKSITNRVYLYSALAQGTTELNNVLESEDTEIMRTALEQFDINIENNKVHGKGGKFTKKGDLEIYCGNAGTATRFLIAIAGLRKGTTIFKGKERMHSRPIEPLLQSLRDLGVKAESINNNNCPPVKIIGTGKIKGGKTKMRGDLSSQFFSALLALAPLCENPVEIEIEEKLVSKPYLEMTIALLKKFGIQVDFSGQFLKIKPQKYISPKKFEIEGDASSASHLLSITTAVGGYLEVYPLPADSVQGDAKFCTVLEKMGAKYEQKENKLILIRNPEKYLKPLVEINLENMPDAAMNAVVLSTLASGESTIKGLSTLRHKETDRISALTTELKKLGAIAEKGDDFISIKGGKELNGAEIETYDDHRMAMCFAVLGAKIKNIDIKDPDCVKKTFPNFWKVFEKMKPKKNIVLSGMRCSGKTELGKRLAKTWEWDFFDTDQYIEEKAGKTINEIVAENGWDYFRELEHIACKKASEMSNTVIALGGGAITFPKNQELLKNSLKIFLQMPLEILCDRIAKTSDRPSLTGQSHIEEMEKIWDERKKIYLETADLVIKFNNNDIEDNANNLLTKLETLYKIISFAKS